MRAAELVMAIIMAIFSLYLMRKSAELPIGWLPGEGPGGGAFPFWLSAAMLVTCLCIVVRWLRRTSPLACSTEPYMDGNTVRLFIISGGSLGLMIGAIHFIGVYGSAPLFLILYMRFFGRHSWVATGVLAGATPIITFLFFEIGLNITLPKGFTEPLFYPLYELFY